MKTLIFFIFFTSVATLFSGTKLPIIGGTQVELSHIVILSPQGVKMLRPNTNEVVEISWGNVDLAVLSKEMPELDRLRQQVILLEKTELLEIREIPDYFSEFMKAPVNIRFNERFKLERRSSADFEVRRQNDTDIYTPQRLTQSGYIETENFDNETRPAFESTVEGLFLRISDHKTSRSRRLIRDLVEHQELFANLLVGLSKLSEIYPEDYYINNAIKALTNFASDPTINIRDQEHIARFVEHARERSAK